MPLNVHPDTALRWVQDAFNVRVGTADEYILRLQTCPACGHSNWAVRFNARSQRMVCFRNDCHLNLFEMVKAVTGRKRTVDVFAFLKSYGDLRLQWQPKDPQQRAKTRMAQALSLGLAPRAKLAEGSMDMAHWSVDWTTPVGRAILAYALRRRIPQELLDGGLVGYFRRGPLVGRLSFLMTEQGQPVFAAGRAVRPEVEPKYLYPPAELCGGRGMGDVLYNLDAVEEGDEVPLAEGVISAISADEKALAMLGNALTERQAVKLAARKPGAVIVLRESNINTNHAERSAALMWRKGTPAFVADLLDGDPNDNPDQMPQVLEAARGCDQRSLLMSRLQARKLKPDYFT